MLTLTSFEIDDIILAIDEATAELALDYPEADDQMKRWAKIKDKLRQYQRVVDRGRD